MELLMQKNSEKLLKEKNFAENSYDAKRMLKYLEDYYKKYGILSTHFTCIHKNDCMDDCQEFTGPKSSFVSSEYEKGNLPRLLFLSLDSGSGEKNPLDRTPIAVRNIEEKRNIMALAPYKHWFRTHEIALHFLNKFTDQIKIEDDVKKYFAHANSAKCCMNKPNKQQANDILFENCRKYLPEELKILNPNIIVTQGNAAKKAIEQFIQKVLRKYDFYCQLIVLNDREIFWLHTYHPRDAGRFNEQRINSNLWEKYSKEFYRGYLNQKTT